MRVTIKGRILEDIATYGSVTVRSLAARHGCSETAVRNAAINLKDAGLIVVLHTDENRQQHLGFSTSEAANRKVETQSYQQRDVLRVFGGAGRHRLTASLLAAAATIITFARFVGELVAI